ALEEGAACEGVCRCHILIPLPTNATAAQADRGASRISGHTSRQLLVCLPDTRRDCKSNCKSSCTYCIVHQAWRRAHLLAAGQSGPAPEGARPAQHTRRVLGTCDGAWRETNACPLPCAAEINASRPVLSRGQDDMQPTRKAH